MSTFAARLMRPAGFWLLLGAAVAFAPIAEARVGGGGSFGSRGSKTWTAPPTTNTAPKAAQPMERSMTPQAGTRQPGATAGTAAQSRPGLFSGGLGKLLMGGLIAGALASIFGVGALASVLGFLLQMALIAGLVMLVMTWWRNRNGQRPAMADARMQGANARMSGMGADTAPREAPREAMSQRAAGGFGGTSGPAVSPLQVQPADFDDFERLLGEIQSAYGRNDLKALETRTTPEMLSYFAEQLRDNERRNVRNEVSGVKLLQGDLAEAWREGNLDYATVAMRFSLIDVTVDQGTGRVVEGSRTQAQEATEVWTFVRPSGGRPGPWELSAIQQA